MANGVNTDNVDPVAISDEVLVNRDGSTGRQKTMDLATQLAGSGAVADKLVAKADISVTDALSAVATDHEERLVDLKTAQTSNLIYAATWIGDLADIVPEFVGQGAEIVDDATGDHTDPLLSETVLDAGRYKGYETTAGAWTRIGGTGLYSKEDKWPTYSGFTVVDFFVDAFNRSGMRGLADGTVEITLFKSLFSTITNLYATTANIANLVATKLTVGVETASTYTGSSIIDLVVDASNRVALRVLPSGFVEAPLLRSTYAEIDELGGVNTAGATGDVLGKTSTNGETYEQTIVTLGNDLPTLADGSNRAAVKFNSKGQMYGGIQDSLRLSRGRATAVSDDYFVTPKMRNYLGNYDLYSVNKTTGDVVAIATSTSNLVDFSDATIDGDACIYTRWEGERPVRMAAALDGSSDPVLFTSTKMIQIIGDSFRKPLGDAVSLQLRGKATSFTYPSVSTGGWSLEQIATYFIENTNNDNYHEATLIIMDGSGDSLANNQAQLPLIIDALTPHFPRWIYVQPGITALSGYEIGGSLYTSWAAAWGWIDDTYPGHFCETLSTMLANSDGSAQDESDIANGWHPTSLRGVDDGLHLNNDSTTLRADGLSGNAVYAQVIDDFLTAKGWI